MGKKGLKVTVNDASKTKVVNKGKTVSVEENSKPPLAQDKKKEGGKG